MLSAATVTFKKYEAVNIFVERSVQAGDIAEIHVPGRNALSVSLHNHGRDDSSSPGPALPMRSKGICITNFLALSLFVVL